ncbi:MAG TPA: mycofactocin-coupled SDR family oxidoreductase [Acidimicrobiales bacterium]|nr:mycofactocin-coupled SDR family oxidoreductase [Acidimicrobiales bacterium]HXZ61418.1 mycofactocin-coupled SDR family oxidoreductase [Acidimicrobiales bacterium]
MTSLEGKVALITGAGRGQGRSHAVRLADEGADIVAVDVCRNFEGTIPYPMATRQDLDETCALVEKAGRWALPVEADVRDLAALRAAVEETVARFGRLDVVICNAGVTSWWGDQTDESAARVWQEVLNVNLTGAWNTLRATTNTMVRLGNGGAIVLVSSTAGLKGFASGVAGYDAYAASKAGLVGLMRGYALNLAAHNIRVNTVHPTAVETMMTTNEEFLELMKAMGDAAALFQNAMPVEMLQPADVSDAIAWLVCDQAKYITGVQLPVDAGFMIR